MKKIKQAARHIASMDYRTDPDFDNRHHPGEVPTQSVDLAEDKIGRFDWMEYRVFCEEYAQAVVELTQTY